jgi:hypothetical protein
MLFDIFNYNIPLALISYAFFSLFLLFMFRRFISNYADPLVFHILWLSSQASFFVIFAERREVGLMFIVFVFSLTTYLVSLSIFISLYDRRKLAIVQASSFCNPLDLKISSTRWKLMVFTLFLLVLYSKKSFLEYALTCQSLSELFAYRFVDLQGRDPIERIFASASYFLNLFLFYGFHKGISKFVPVFCIFLLLIIGLASGGRSALIALIASFGTYVFYFSHEFKSRSIRNFNRVTLLLLSLAIVIAVFVTSFYDANATLKMGMLVIFNRVFAAPDGVEYYLNYAGEINIDMGLLPYFMSVFGLYVKNIFGVEVKNIGWQLTELAVGDVSFAQGSNYTVLLQSVVFNYYFSPFYAAFAGWLVARLRYLYSVSSPLGLLYFVISSLSFVIATDLEYFIFLISSIIVIYFMFVYPILRFRI